MKVAAGEYAKTFYEWYNEERRDTHKRNMKYGRSSHAVEVIYVHDGKPEYAREVSELLTTQVRDILNNSKNFGEPLNPQDQLNFGGKKEKHFIPEYVLGNALAGLSDEELYEFLNFNKSFQAALKSEYERRK